MTLGIEAAPTRPATSGGGCITLSPRRSMLAAAAHRGPYNIVIEGRSTPHYIALGQSRSVRADDPRVRFPPPCRRACARTFARAHTCDRAPRPYASQYIFIGARAYRHVAAGDLTLTGRLVRSAFGANCRRATKLHPSRVAPRRWPSNARAGARRRPNVHFQNVVLRCAGEFLQAVGVDTGVDTGESQPARAGAPLSIVARAGGPSHRGRRDLGETRTSKNARPIPAGHLAVCKDEAHTVEHGDSEHPDSDAV